MKSFVIACIAAIVIAVIGWAYSIACRNLPTSFATSYVRV